MFVFRPGLLLEGSIGDILIDVVALGLIIVPVQALVQRYWLQRLNWIEAVLFLAALLLVFPMSLPTLFLAALLQGVAVVLHMTRYRRSVVG
jgi:TRAP-type uncharacterized transport system fused permease subunit